MLNSAKNEEKVEKNMKEKKVTLRPFAPNGLLTDTQTAQLKAWWSGEKRSISTREIVSILKISRQKIYDSLKKNPERPFDELKLKTLNVLIQIYNKDIQSFKEEQQIEVKESKTNKKRASELIKKVGE